MAPGWLGDRARAVWRSLSRSQTVSLWNSDKFVCGEGRKKNKREKAAEEKKRGHGKTQQWCDQTGWPNSTVTMSFYGLADLKVCHQGEGASAITALESTRAGRKIGFNSGRGLGSCSLP